MPKTLVVNVSSYDAMKQRGDEEKRVLSKTDDIELKNSLLDFGFCIDEGIRVGNHKSPDFDNLIYNYVRKNLVDINSVVRIRSLGHGLFSVTFHFN